jgi:hypothetical protein
MKMMEVYENEGLLSPAQLNSVSVHALEATDADHANKLGREEDLGAETPYDLGGAEAPFEEPDDDFAYQIANDSNLPRWSEEVPDGLPQPHDPRRESYLSVAPAMEQ